MFRKFIYVCLLMLLAGCTSTAQMGTLTPTASTAAAQPLARAAAGLTEVFTSASVTATPPPVASSVAQNQIPVSSCTGPRVRRDELVPSATLGEEIPVRLYLPPCDPPAGKGWPVIYLLHGAGWTERHWDDVLIDEVAEAGRVNGTLPPLILVFPRRIEDSRQPGPEGDLPFEHFVVSELIPWIDRHTPAQADRAYRAIGGISLGGFWALEIAFHHPELFDSVGGHSPVVGSPGDALSPMSLMASHAADLAKLRIWLDVGDQDGLGPGTAQLAAGLKAAGIPVTFHQWPGGHVEPYWEAHTGDYLAFYAASWARD
jgi:enterochelin esterase-like enzyme